MVPESSETNNNNNMADVVQSVLDHMFEPPSEEETPQGSNCGEFDAAMETCKSAFETAKHDTSNAFHSSSDGAGGMNVAAMAMQSATAECRTAVKLAAAKCEQQRAAFEKSAMQGLRARFSEVRDTLKKSTEVATPPTVHSPFPRSDPIRYTPPSQVAATELQAVVAEAQHKASDITHAADLQAAAILNQASINSSRIQAQSAHAYADTDTSFTYVCTYTYADRYRYVYIDIEITIDIVV